MSVFSTLSVLIAVAIVGAQALDGPEITLSKGIGCLTDGVTWHEYSVVWAPGQCQPDPSNAERSVIIECTESETDDQVRIRAWDNTSCEGNPETNRRWSHMVRVTQSETHFWNNECERYNFPDIVRKACAPSEPAVTLTKGIGCTEESTTFYDYDLVWQPSVCQLDPSTEGRSVMIDCTEDPHDDAMRIRAWGNSNCEGTPETNRRWSHNVKVTLTEQHFWDNECETFLLPDLIREACAPAPAPQLILEQVVGCTLGNQVTYELPIVWTPGQCQANPSDAESSMILDCAADGGLHIVGYDGAECGGEPRSDKVVEHNRMLALSEEILENNSCVKYMIPEDIREACTPPASTMILEQVVGCTLGYQVSHDLPIVWTPGQCQANPSDDEASMILDCAEDGGLHVVGFNGLECGGEPRSDKVLQHNSMLAFSEEILENNSCLKYMIPEAIREACAPPAPQLVLEQVVGCHLGSQDTYQLPIVWTPGQCQSNPSDETSSMLIDCADDGGLHIVGYNGVTCEGEPRSDKVVQHNSGLAFSEEILANDACVKYLIPEVIREECAASPTALPAPEPELDGPCQNAELLRVRTHKRLCRSFNDDEAACEVAGCNYRANRRPRRRCKSKQDDVTCEGISTEHCCGFEGCSVSNGACVGTFAGW